MSGREGAGEDALLYDARLSLGPAKLADLFPEGEAFRQSLITYSVLLVLAAFIASFGLYANSDAAIIGAMVVAPLGGAIMAFAGALVTARTRWMWVTALQVALGSLGVIAIGWLVALVMPTLLTLTPSLEARTAPGLLDLGVALAAGAAGAFVAVRRTGVDALPGVAIAVSLVPPLATVGICLELGLLDDAGGALLLFASNFCAITVVACIVFALSGAAPSVEMVRERHHVRYGFIAAVIALVIVAVPLAITGFDRSIDLVRATTGAPYVEAWLGGRDLKVVAWHVDGSTVELELEGADAPADAGPLAEELAAAYGVPVTLRVHYVATQDTVVDASP